MHRPPGIRRSAVASERSVSMRLIATVGLALLLLFALAATSHGEAGEAGAGSGPLATSLDSFAQAPALAQADSRTQADSLAQADSRNQAAASPSAPAIGVGVGVGLCALGMLCGLAAMLLLSRSLRRPGLLLLLLPRTPADPSSSPFSLRPRVTALSLTRLGLSRT